ncbi:ribonuclease H-like domain-containing protein [Tanacetum coccineum]
MPARFNDYVVNSSRKYGLNKNVTYSNLNTSNYCFSTNLNKSSEPNSYYEAVKNPNWVDAMNNEIETLNGNNTWTIYDLPEGRKREGFDYLETLSPVVKMSTVRNMLNVAMCNNWDLFQLNINNAFLYGDLYEDVYMTLSPSQFMHAPLVSQLDVVLRVLRYLKGSPGSDIQININGNLKLRAYADSDWARCPTTKKSVLGYCVFLGDSLVIWKSKKQSTLSRSSVEAEYRSTASATCEVIWFSNLLDDMGVTGLLPVVMYCDNSSTLQIVVNPVFHEISKHFEIDVHLVREKVASGVIKTEKIHTSQQIFDVLARVLDIEQHEVICEKLGLLDMFKVEKLKEGC